MKKGIKRFKRSQLYFIFDFLSSLCEGRGSYISARVFPSEDPILSCAHIICCYLQAPVMEVARSKKSCLSCTQHQLNLAPFVLSIVSFAQEL